MATGRRGYTMDQVLAAIHGSRGIMSVVATQLGCDWRTARKYVTRWKATQQAFNDEREKLLDLAESALVRAIKEGDVNAAKWVLSRLGKDRGFGDKLDVTSGGKPVVLVWKGDGGDDGKR